MKGSLGRVVTFWMLTTIFFTSFAVAAVTDDLSVGNYKLVSSRRVTITDFEYTYSATATNSGSTPYVDVAASLTSKSSNTKVIAGSLQFGNVPSLGSTVSTNFFVIRQNRLFPFNPSDLVWTISGNAPPTALFVASPDGRVIRFDASPSTDPDGTIATYQWDFGDGQTGTGATNDHAYAIQANYTAALTVTDNKGAQSTFAQGVTVGCEIQCDDADPCTWDGCDAGSCLHIPIHKENCPSPAVPTGVILRDFVIAQNPLHINQRVSASITLEADADYNDYILEFLLFPDTSPGDSTEQVGTSLGTAVIPTVKAGIAQYQAELVVPADAEPGSYILHAHAYPEAAFVQSPPRLQPYLIVEDPVLPVLDIVDFYPDQQVLLLDPENTVDPQAVTTYRDAPFSGTLEVVSHNNGTQGISIRAYANWKGGLVPLRIWDANQQKYVESLLIDQLEGDVPMSMYLEIAMSDTEAGFIRLEIPAQTPLLTKVVLTVNEGGSIPEAECIPSEGSAVNCRHSLETDATLFAPPVTAMLASPQVGAFSAMSLVDDKLFQPSLVFEKNFNKFSNNKYVGAGINLSGMARLSASGANSSVVASIPIKLFDNNFDFASASIFAQAPINSNAQLNCDVVLLRNTKWQQNLDVFSADGVSYEVILPFPSIAKEASYGSQIFVGPIPVYVELGARGSFGIDGRVKAVSALAGPKAGQLEFQVTPFSNIGAFADATVGIAGVGPGIEGNLILIDTRLPTTVGGTLDVLLDPQNSPILLTGTLSERMDCNLNFLRGDISAYVSYPTIKWCKKWGVKYPCGLKSARKDFTICSWPGFAVGPYTLLNKSQSGFQIPLPCQPTTCSQVGAQCGTISTCGTAIDCGQCPAGMFCNGNVCADICTPPTCSDARAECGTIPSCAGPIECGSCPPETSCENNRCIPICIRECGSLGFECGTASNNCGETLNCGQCPSGFKCDANKCVPPICTPKTCVDRGWECGSGLDGCGGTLSCGSCGSGFQCLSHMCVRPCPSGYIRCDEFTCVKPPQVCP